MLVLRPADAAETTVAWRVAMENTQTPTALILSRQNIDDLPSASGNRYKDALQAMRGGYIINKVENPDVILVGNGSEVATLVATANIIVEEGIKAQVVSVPSIGLFLDRWCTNLRAYCRAALYTAACSANWRGIRARPFRRFGTLQGFGREIRLYTPESGRKSPKNARKVKFFSKKVIFLAKDSAYFKK